MAGDWKTLLSLGIAVGGAVVLASSAAATERTWQAIAQEALAAAYMVWALFWGFPAFWRWWRGSSLGISSFPHAWRAGLGRVFLSLVFLLTGGYVFSVLGGGIYHFVKHRRSR